MESLMFTADMLMYLPGCERNHANTTDGTLKCPGLVIQIRTEKRNFLAVKPKSVIVVEKSSWGINW